MLKTMKGVIMLSLCVLLAGCIWGDRVPASKTLSLEFPNSDIESLAIDAPQVQDALKLVRDVLVPQDYELVDVKEPFAAATFIKGFRTEHQSACVVNVYIQNGRLDIQVSGGGGVSAPFTKAGQQVVASLRDAFVRQYGEKRIVVRTN
jgi:hypothetical protein